MLEPVYRDKVDELEHRLSICKYEIELKDNKISDLQDEVYVFKEDFNKMSDIIKEQAKIIENIKKICSN